MNLLAHQQQLIDRTAARPRYGLLWDPGCGKTLAVLAACQDRPAPTVIAGPVAAMDNAWLRDLETFRELLPDLVPLRLYGGPQRRARLFSDLARDLTAHHVIVTTHGTFRQPDTIDGLIRLGIRRLVIDESAEIRNPETKLAQASIQVADQCDEFFALSGEQAPNGPHEYWTILRCIDKRRGGIAGVPGDQGQPAFRSWCMHWCLEQTRMIRVKTRATRYRPSRTLDKVVTTGWKPRPEREMALERIVSEVTWAAKLTDFEDMPPQRDQRIDVRLSREERNAYDDVRDELATVLKDGTELTVAAGAKVMKLRQLASGFSYLLGSAKRTGSSKLDATIDLIATLGTKPCIIWAEFKEEIRILEKLVGEVEGRSVRTIFGETGPMERKESIDDFQAGDLNTLVCNPQSVGHCVTLTAAPYAIFYSWGYDWEKHKQARGRNWRKGQTLPVVYYYITATDTIDGVMRHVIGQRRNDSEAFINALRAHAERRQEHDA